MSKLKQRLTKTASNDLELPEIQLINSYVNAVREEIKNHPDISKLTAEQKEKFLDNGIHDSLTQFHHISEYEFLFKAIEEVIVNIAKEAVSNAGDIMIDEFIDL